MLEFFNTYVRTKLGEVVAALEAMTFGDEETKRGMAVLLKKPVRDRQKCCDQPLFSLPPATIIIPGNYENSSLTPCIKNLGG